MPTSKRTKSESPYLAQELRDLPRASLQAALDLLYEGQKKGDLVLMNPKVVMTIINVAIIRVVDPVEF